MQCIPSAAEAPGVGYTVTKKAGNAPERNRIRRRLRAAVETCRASFKARHDYVLIGRREVLAEPFDRLASNVRELVDAVHAKNTNARRS